MIQIEIGIAIEIEFDPDSDFDPDETRVKLHFGSRVQRLKGSWFFIENSARYAYLVSFSINLAVFLASGAAHMKLNL